MDQPTDINQLDQSALQNLLGGSSPSLIPESLVTTFTIGFIVLNVLGILFFVFYVVGLIRKWKVESAVFHMQKDLAEIKAQLAKPAQPAASTPEPVRPAESNQVIAADTEPATSDTRLS